MAPPSDPVGNLGGPSPGSAACCTAAPVRGKMGELSGRTESNEAQVELQAEYGNWHVPGTASGCMRAPCLYTMVPWPSLLLARKSASRSDGGGACTSVTGAAAVFSRPPLQARAPLELSWKPDSWRVGRDTTPRAYAAHATR